MIFINVQVALEAFETTTACSLIHFVLQYSVEGLIMNVQVTNIYLCAPNGDQVEVGQKSRNA